MKNFCILVACLCLTACHCSITQEDFMRANYGPRPSIAEAEYKARRYFEQVLIDPDSMKLSCSQEIKKGWTRENICDTPTMGYLYLCKVNAKNRLGGYTGNTLFAVLINGDGVSAINMESSPNRLNRPGNFAGYTE